MLKEIDWRPLAAGVFEMRAPFGGTIERRGNGDDLTYTALPPVAGAAPQYLGPRFADALEALTPATIDDMDEAAAITAWTLGHAFSATDTAATAKLLQMAETDADLANSLMTAGAIAIVATTGIGAQTEDEERAVA